MFSIAIDGPAGAGKSSVAKAVAAELGFTYVDTGAMYRAIALYMLESIEDIEDQAAVSAALPQVRLALEYGPQGQRTLLNGRDVSADIRAERVSIATSRWVAHVPKVREFLLNAQKELAEKNNVVMDGRDIGTVILPRAQLKIFLTASAEERARRRTAQLREAGGPADYEQVLNEVIKRDRQDAEQLDMVPADAVVLDSTGLGFDQVLNRITGLARERMQAYDEG